MTIKTCWASSAEQIRDGDRLGDATANDGIDDDTGGLVWKADGDADNDPSTDNYKTVKFRVHYSKIHF